MSTLLFSKINYTENYIVEKYFISKTKEYRKTFIYRTIEKGQNS